MDMNIDGFWSTLAFIVFLVPLYVLPLLIIGYPLFLLLKWFKKQK